MSNPSFSEKPSLSPVCSSTDATSEPVPPPTDPASEPEPSPPPTVPASEPSPPPTVPASAILTELAGCREKVHSQGPFSDKDRLMLETIIKDLGELTQCYQSDANLEDALARVERIEGRMRAFVAQFVPA